MSRSYNQSRLQNFDDDSDDGDYQTQAAVRKTAARRPYTLQATAPARRSGANSSDDSQDENDSRLRSDNAINAPANQYNGAKPIIRNNSVRRIVAKPVSNSNLLDTVEPSTSGTSGKGFVPRDLSQKIRRNHTHNDESRSRNQSSSHHSNRSSAAEEEEDNRGYSRSAPKTFLSEQAPEPIYTSKIPAPSTSNHRGKQQPKSQPPSRHQHPDVPQVPERNDSEDDDQSVESSNTVEEFQEPRFTTVESTAREPSMFDAYSHTNPLRTAPKSLRIPGQSAVQRHPALQLEGTDEFDTEVIKDGEFYTDFVHRSQAFSSSPSQPVKSGRYEDESQGSEKRTNWMGESAKSTSSYTAPGVKSSWTSVIAPPTNVPGGAQSSPSNRFSFVLIAHPRGIRTEHVQCTVVRDRRASINGKLHPTYQLILDETRKPILLAQKMNMNRTSNYHLFDLTRAQLSTKLSKKSGNYIGKLRAKNTARTEYVLLNQNSEREEIAGVKFDRVSLIDQLKEGNQPRKMKIMVPPLDKSGIPVPNRTNDSDAGSLAEKLSEYESTALGKGSKDVFVFESKDPVFENGNFRLNFHGRVNKPSVKNFQMVSREDIEDVICQFGKVEEDVFHLDFKAPLNACQAFAFALCQFNL